MRAKNKLDKWSGMMAVTNADKAYQFILEKIVTAEMAPGSVIEERVLMEEIGLGRTPIREALKRLQAERFVVVRSRRGMFVAPITYSDINRIYEVRIEIEAFNMRLASNRITDERIGMIKDHILFCAESENGSVETQISLDRKFHFLTYEACHNQWLIADLKRYYYMSQRIWFYGYNSLDINWIGLNDHPKILEALTQRNSEKAEKRIRSHIKNFQEVIKEYLF